MTGAPPLADIEAIGAIAQRVPRNLRITQAYHELSAAVALVTGSGANWCTFATWASKQAHLRVVGGQRVARRPRRARFAMSAPAPKVHGSA